MPIVGDGKGNAINQAKARAYVGRVDRRRGEPRKRMVCVDRPGVSGERRTAGEEGPRSSGLVPRPTVGIPLATCMLFGFVAVAGRHQLGLARIVFLLSFWEVGGTRPLSFWEMGGTRQPFVGLVRRPRRNRLVRLFFALSLC